MSDGTLSVRRRQPKASEAQSSDAFSLASLRAGTFENFLTGTLSSIGQGNFRDKGKAKARPVGDVHEFKVESRRKKKLKEYDRLLKSFKYSAALDAVLRKVRSSLSRQLSPTLFRFLANPPYNFIFPDTRTCTP